MDIDDQLALAWGEVSHAGIPLERLRTRIKRQRRRLILQRCIEVLLTVFALIVFGLALHGSRMTPIHWLLLPFYAVFLPIAWALILRAPKPASSDVIASVNTFARLRMTQLRAGLREIRIARHVALALLTYAALAAGSAWWFGSAEWRLDAAWLLLVALLWALGTHVITAHVRRRRLREYRTMRRLVD